MRQPRTAAVVAPEPRRERAGGPVRGRPALLDRGMSAGAAFEAVMRANLGHLRANERGVLEGRDPEYLHQMRVALRRLRSGLGVFSTVLPESPARRWRAEMKWLAGRLGPARDWDVFLAETLAPVEEAFGPRPGLARFAARCRRLRSAAAARARRAVRSARYERLVAALQAGPPGEEDHTRSDGAARPVADFATGVLEARYERVLEKGRSLGRLDSRKLHRLRIAIKKFRYASDFFATLYDEKAARAAEKRLSRLQDILGAMNDAASAEGLAAQGFNGMSGTAARETRGLVLGWSRGRAATLRRELKSAWKEFSAAEKFW